MNLPQPLWKVTGVDRLSCSRYRTVSPRLFESATALVHFSSGDSQKTCCLAQLTMEFGSLRPANRVTLPEKAADLVPSSHYRFLFRCVSEVRFRRR